MTDNKHSITPPPELVQQWRNGGPSYAIANNAYEHYIANQAAQWGADMELAACCEWLTGQSLHLDGSYLRAARRPKPPSLKERALQAWAAVEAGTDDQTAMVVIRRALEALDD